MKLIPLEEVKKILFIEKLEWEHSDFLDVIEEYVEAVSEEISYLPTIDLSVIDKMIEEYQHCPGEEGFYGLGILGELKSRLSTNL